MIHITLGIGASADRAACRCSHIKTGALRGALDSQQEAHAVNLTDKAVCEGPQRVLA